MSDFEYINKNEYKKASKNIWEYVRFIQGELKGIATINPILIGSSRHRLVTRNLSNNLFDFDFNFVITKIGVDYIDEPKTIRKLFLDILNDNNKNFNFKTKKKNRSRVIRIHSNDNDYNVEFAILVYKDNILNLIKFDKKNKKYILNEENVISLEEMKQEITKIKKENGWEFFKKKYLEKKNKNKNRKSISVLKETINEFKQQI